MKATELQWEVKPMAMQNAYYINTANGNQSITIAEVYGHRKDSLAIANLIAAAPEMCEALKGLLAILRRAPIAQNPAYLKGVAAVAKAEGKTEVKP